MSSNLTSVQNGTYAIETYANGTFTNGTFINGTSAKNSEDGGKLNILLAILYGAGIIGNAAAILALRTGHRRIKNRKHLLLLTSLAANDLVALLGMMSTMVVSKMMPEFSNSQLHCGLRVVLRVFGIGSVCIAVTMALERYLAVTRPFLYQKQVTYYMIRTALIASWFWAAVLTCAPVMGLGRYYDADTNVCKRYREAVTTTEFIYAAFYAVFGTLLCLVLVYCNLAVIRALYAITTPRAGNAPVVRHVSKASCRRARSLNSGTSLPGMHHNASTAEEVTFSRLMATLSVLFMICWMPQMLTTTLYLILGSGYWKSLAILGYGADLLMLLNYVLDPVLYVLVWRRSRSRSLCHCLVSCFKRGHKTSTESVSLKTSCCPQDTTVVSESVSAEMRPLRTLPAQVQIYPSGPLHSEMED